MITTATITSMMYLFITVTFADGSIVYEGKGPSGPTVESCRKFGDYVVGNKLYSQAKPVVRVDVNCVSLPVPK